MYSGCLALKNNPFHVMFHCNITEMRNTAKRHCMYRCSLFQISSQVLPQVEVEEPKARALVYLSISPTHLTSSNKRLRSVIMTVSSTLLGCGQKQGLTSDNGENNIFHPGLSYFAKSTSLPFYPQKELEADFLFGLSSGRIHFFCAPHEMTGSGWYKICILPFLRNETSAWFLRQISLTLG